MEPRDDIIWDMENLFGPGQIKDFNLKELELPVGVNEIKTLIGALQYNTYFRSLIAKNLPFDKVRNSVCLLFYSFSNFPILSFNDENFPNLILEHDHTRRGVSQVQYKIG